MKKLIIILLCVLLFSCTSMKTSNIDIWQVVEDAYVYTFPLVIMDETKNSAKSVDGVILENRLLHSMRLADAGFKDVVTPNVDTVYTQAWYDLSKDPMIYIHPESDRFCTLQLLDAWTNTPKVIDEPGVYAITLSSYDGYIPEGVTRVDVNTSLAWSITRVVLSGSDDLLNVYDIQNRMLLMPLSAYISNEEYKPQEVVRAQNSNSTPLSSVLMLDLDEYFNRANELMSLNPPDERDKEIIERIKSINVGPGLIFDKTILGDDANEKWSKISSMIKLKLASWIQRFSKELGIWTYFSDPIGNFLTEYDYRAIIAMVGLGANPTSVAIYAKTNLDVDGNTLNGDKAYILHIEEEPIVKENGFWSITAYGEDNYLIDNPLDRYCINDRSKLNRNEDGSIDILLSTEIDENNPNLLPISNDHFHLYMRIYNPDIDKLDSWNAPTIKQCK